MRDDMIEGLTRKHLRGFNTDVAARVLLIVNGCGIKHRLIDSTHLLLYAPDKSRPFKVSASRPKVQQLRYLDDFMEKHDLHPPERPAFDTGYKGVVDVSLPEPETVSDSPSDGPAEERAAIAPPEPPKSESAEPEQPTDLPEGWTILLHSRTKDPMPNWMTDGTEYACRRCGFQTGNRHTIAGHDFQNHTSPEEKAVSREKSAATKTRKDQAYLVMERVAREMVEAIGWKIDEGDGGEIARLTAERDKALAELSDCRAKLDLIRETMTA